MLKYFQDQGLRLFFAADAWLRSLFTMLLLSETWHWPPERMLWGINLLLIATKNCFYSIVKRSERRFQAVIKAYLANRQYCLAEACLTQTTRKNEQLLSWKLCLMDRDHLCSASVNCTEVGPWPLASVRQKMTGKKEMLSCVRWHEWKSWSHTMRLAGCCGPLQNLVHQKHLRNLS